MNRAQSRQIKYNSLVNSGFTASEARKYRDHSFSTISSLIKQSSKLSYQEKSKEVYRVAKAAGKSTDEAAKIRNLSADTIKERYSNRVQFEDMNKAEIRPIRGTQYMYVVQFEAVKRGSKEKEIIYMSIISPQRPLKRDEIYQKTERFYNQDNKSRYAETAKMLKSSLKVVRQYIDKEYAK